MNNMELLAPAGSLEALQAAVESGADAVYIGGTKFNARAFAENLDEDLLKNAVEYAHVRGAKVYVTVNILIHQSEIRDIIEYIYYLYSISIDAVIVQDIGLAVLIRSLLPDFEVHCSTQMAIHNIDGAEYLSKLGIKRVVLARELTLAEVNEIAEASDIDAEIFIHGALCVCYSGQCYMSSLIGGRSGNRGKCAQPCRKRYTLTGGIESGKSAHLISTRDLNTYENLYEIADSNIASLKIEGRMKRPEYVAIIVKNYRDAIDCITSGKKDCISSKAQYELLIAFNREFTKGYLFGEKNQGIVSTERPDNRGIYIGKVLNQKGSIAEVMLEDGFLNDGDGIEVVNPKGKNVGCIISGIKKDGVTVKKAYAGDRVKLFIPDKVMPGSIVNKTLDSELFDKARNEYAYTNRRKVELEGVFTARLGETPTFEIKDRQGNTVKAVSEEVVQKAEKLAMTEEKVLEQLQKTGDTPYSFKKFDIELDSNCFLSVKSINNLRRNALDQLSSKRIEVPGREKGLDAKKTQIPQNLSGSRDRANEKLEIIAAIRNIDNAKAAVAAGADAVYIIGDYNYKTNLSIINEAAKFCKEQGRSIYYVLPQITRNNEIKHIESMLEETIKNWPDMGLVLSNLGHIPLAKRLKITNTRGNFSLNVFNSLSANYLSNEDIEGLCVSPELNLSQIKELSCKSTIGLEGLVYGYIPAMVTEYCPGSTELDCSSCKRQGCGDYGIMDEREKLFRVINLGNCRNIILNSDVLCAFDNLSSIIEGGIRRLRLDFYVENQYEVSDIIKAYKQKLENLTGNMENPIIESIKQKGFTKGHYFRGVD